MRYVVVDGKLFVKYIDQDGRLKLFNIDDLIDDLKQDYIDEHNETVQLVLQDLKDGKLKYE